ncbi:MAG: hypothetical protein LBJ00_06040 [Planctomycetaceae bacterium]|jgi:hypothetical protein|nr:hypothetical protein [Planctomycetaceae bacterium]
MAADPSIILLPCAATVLYNAIIPGTSTTGTKLDVAYLEYVNGNPIHPPEIPPTEIETYLESLNHATDRDYLRCNILAHSVKIINDIPTLNIIIVSDNTVGNFGKPFSATANSHIYSITLAASQATQQEDLLFARVDYPIETQIPKPENGGIMTTVNLQLIL